MKIMIGRVVKRPILTAKKERMSEGGHWESNALWVWNIGNCIGTHWSTLGTALGITLGTALGITLGVALGTVELEFTHAKKRKKCKS